MICFTKSARSGKCPGPWLRPDNELVEENSRECPKAMEDHRGVVRCTQLLRWRSSRSLCRSCWATLARFQTMASISMALLDFSHGPEVNQGRREGQTRTRLRPEIESTRRESKGLSLFVVGEMIMGLGGVQSGSKWFKVVQSGRHGKPCARSRCVSRPANHISTNCHPRSSGPGSMPHGRITCLFPPSL